MLNKNSEILAESI